VHDDAGDLLQGLHVAAAIGGTHRPLKRAARRQQVDAPIVRQHPAFGGGRRVGRPRIHEHDRRKQIEAARQHRQRAHEYRLGSQHGQPPDAGWLPRHS
jgi:hypothetical protein